MKKTDWPGFFHYKNALPSARVKCSSVETRQARGGFKDLRLWLGLAVLAVALSWSSRADTWEQIGNSNQSVNLAVRTLLVDPTSNVLYAGGVGNTVCKWDGTNWTSLGSLTGSVNALAVYKGELYAGGMLYSLNNIAKWNGSSWVSVSGVGASGTVNAMTVYNNKLVVAGAFYTTGGVYTWGFADFDGTTWETFAGRGYGLNPSGSAIWLLKVINGSLYAGGLLGIPNTAISTGLLAWDGANWTDATGGAGISMWTTYALTLHNNSLYAGGNLTSTSIIKGVAQVSGGGCAQVGNGLGYSVNDGSNIVFTLESFHGKLYAGGSFTNSGAAPMVSIACWNGSSWSAAGGGVGGSQPYVFCSAIYNDRLIIGGQFNHADGKVIANIARLVESSTPLAVSSPARSGDGTFGFTVSGPAGSNVVVEASAALGALNAWVGLQTNLMGVNPFVFSDPQSVNQTIRYYRLRIIP